MGSVETGIIQKLEKAFSPAHLEVINESASHNVPKGSESHFKVVIVSDSFNGLSAVKRHQSVYAVLADELKSTVHALAIHAYMQEEWSKTSKVPGSPNCMGGSGVF
jgi:BolA protein